MQAPRIAQLKAAILLATLAGSLAGCGTSATNRLGTGTASGAATGAAFGLIGGPIGVVLGGAIGGGIGALTASTTTPKQINLDNIGKTAPAATQSPGPDQTGQPGLRRQIDQYQTQPQPLEPLSQPNSNQAVESQPLAPPVTR